MLLLIDAGNTRVKWALVPSPASGDHPLGQWLDWGMADHAGVQELGAAWKDRRIDHVLVSNVAGGVMRATLENLLGQALGPQPVPLEWFASQAQRAGVTNRYREPARLGCDRFASAIGAHAMFPGEPLLVATCGTATTVDAVSADGIFLGGMILPGLGLMASSLARNTAQLPEVAQHLDVAEPFADHTDAAIVSGCLAAQTGAIERALAAHGKRHAAPRCVLSGGAARLIAPHLATVPTIVDNLVLIGLHHVAMRA